MDLEIWLKELSLLGYKNIKEDDNSYIINSIDDKDKFNMWIAGEWIHLGQTIFANDELVDNANAKKTLPFILKFQNRCLGCRFAIDNVGSLGIVCDVHATENTAKNLQQSIEQMIFVGDVFLELMERILDTGKLPSEKDIDLAFAE